MPKGKTHKHNIEEEDGKLEHEVVDKREHVLLRPFNYIGSVEKLERKIHILKENEDRCVLVDTEMPIGLEQAGIKETLGNATDMVVHSMKHGHKDIKVIVTADREWITVTNQGMVIPVEMWSSKKKSKLSKKLEKLYRPEVLFTKFMTSSNYKNELDKNKTAIGTNGLGAKIVNTFSLEFFLTIYDPIREKKYTQRYAENMTVIDPPKVKDYTGKRSEVTVRYKLDVQRFGYKKLPREFIDLFRRHCMDISYNCGISVSFNDHTFQIAPNDIAAHGSYYFDLKKNAYIVHYNWDDDVDVSKSKKGIETSDDGSIATVRLLVVDTPNNASILAFTNSVINADGGEHVKYAMKGVAESVLTTVNQGKKRITAATRGRGARGRGGRGRGATTAAAATRAAVKAAVEKKDTIHLTMADVKNHLSIIVSVRVADPKFGGGQNKDVLTGCIDKAKVLKIDIEPKKLNQVLKWSFVEFLRKALELKNMKKLNTRDKSSWLGGGNHERANHAGKGWPKCEGTTLTITEGNSASGYVTALISSAGRDKVGSLTLKGKPLNCVDASPNSLKKNEEIRSIVKALGLQYGMDYSIRENYETLNYDGVCIITDKDYDGDHIFTLITGGFFYHFWPSLFHRRRCYVSRWLSALYRIYIGKQLHSLFTEEEFKQFTAAHMGKRFEAKYCKGLGSNTATEARSDFTNSKQMFILGDKNAEESIDVAMNKKNIKDRKKWILERDFKDADKMKEFESKYIRPINPATDIIHYRKTLTGYINSDHLEFSIFNLERSVPYMLDGLKPSERKIIAAGIAHFRNGLNKKIITIAAFGGKVISDFAYHHGDKSLQDSIARFTTTHVSFTMNNLPIFQSESIIGDRNKGNDAISQARYANILLSNWVKHCFIDVDMKIVPYNTHGDDRVEPTFMLPIIPLVLVNGAEGIGTGWSTNIINYSVVDVVNVLRWKIDNYLEGKPYVCGMKPTAKHLDLHRGPPLRPFYRNFKGKTKIVNMSKATAKETLLLGLRTRGLYDYDSKKKTVDIDELPVGMFATNFRDNVAGFVADKLVTDMVDSSDDVKMKFKLTGVKQANFDSQVVGYDTLKIETFKSMRNMNLMNAKGVCVNYLSSYHIVDDFFDERIKWYGIRKKYLLGILRSEIKDCTDKVRFIRAVLSHYFSNQKTKPNEEQQAIIDKYQPINTIMVEEDVIYQRMDEYEPPIPRDIYTRLNHSSFNLGKIRNLEDIIAKKEAEKKKLKATPPAQIWRDDLDALEKAVRAEKFWKCENLDGKNPDNADEIEKYNQDSGDEVAEKSVKKKDRKKENP